MSTIEGGMICTNEKKIYNLARILRSHGLARELKNKNLEKKFIKKYPQLSPQFIFLYPGYNMRNTEIGAVLGLSQLKRLNANNRKRTENFKFFLKHLDSRFFFKNFNLKGSSNYAFPIILKKKSIKLDEANMLKIENIIDNPEISLRKYITISKLYQDISKISFIKKVDETNYAVIVDDKVKKSKTSSFFK